MSAAESPFGVTTFAKLVEAGEKGLLATGWAKWNDKHGEWWAPPEEQPDHEGNFGMRLHEAIEEQMLR